MQGQTSIFTLQTAHDRDIHFQSAQTSKIHKPCNETEATSQVMTTAEMAHTEATNLTPHHVPPASCSKFPPGQAGLPWATVHLPMQMS